MAGVVVQLIAGADGASGCRWWLQLVGAGDGFNWWVQVVASIGGCRWWLQLVLMVDSDEISDSS
jgi:hypothetical protein